MADLHGFEGYAVRMRGSSFVRKDEFIIPEGFGQRGEMVGIATEDIQNGQYGIAFTRGDLIRWRSQLAKKFIQQTLSAALTIGQHRDTLFSWGTQPPTHLLGAPSLWMCGLSKVATKHSLRRIEQ